MSLPYSLAAQRAESAMYTVEVQVTCTEWRCEGKIPCTVDGTWVTVGQCPHGCEFNEAEVTDTALGIAAGCRMDLIHHMIEASKCR